ncbi:MAG: DUF4410 domain-containing protein [Deltaproteobacteria bacterium]|nr:DUF4410 domain-containing protein [Deltaproteobacteria bacterium]TLN01232.1 MAG: DUF4410 domain-containing protein [bacterium]
MKKSLVALFISLVLITAGAQIARSDESPLPKPDVLTEEAIFTSEKLSAYDTLIIRDFTTDGAEYSRVDEDEKVKIEAMKPLLIKMISESLAMQLKSRKLFNNVVINGAPEGKAVILEGAITEFNAGSRALKFFVGFGAGKAYLLVKGRLLDAQTGRELATFVDRETGYRGAVGMESYEDLFPHQAKSLGENISQFVEKLY